MLEKLTNFEGFPYDNFMILLIRILQKTWHTVTILYVLITEV